MVAYCLKCPGTVMGPKSCKAIEDPGAQLSPTPTLFLRMSLYFLQMLKIPKP